MDLVLQPAERSPGELLVRGSVGEGISNWDILEALEDSALHGQFVEIRVEEGDDPFGEGRRAVKVHGGNLAVLDSGGRMAKCSWTRLFIQVAKGLEQDKTGARGSSVTFPYLDCAQSLNAADCPLRCRLGRGRGD